MSLRNRRLSQASPTLSAALDRYLSEVSKKKKSYEQEISIARTWRSTALANRPIAAIKNADLVRQRDIWEAELAPATVVRRFALLGPLFSVAMKDWNMSYITHNPVHLIRQPAVNNARDRRIHTDIRIRGVDVESCPRDEIDWLIKSSTSKILPTVMKLALETGLRRSEIVRIHRNDLDFETGALFIPDSKIGKARYVPLSPMARFSLIMYLTKNNNKGLIFKVTASAITQAFVRAVRNARDRYVALCEEFDQEPRDHFVDLRFHDLRHEATSRLAEIYEMHELAKITGHSDTRMLLRYYHPDTATLVQKMANSAHGQRQFNEINRMLLNF